MLDKIVSVHRDGELYAPTLERVNAEASSLCITFDKLIRATPFVDRIHTMLTRLEQVYGCPVDIEFATDGQKFYILQCRALSQAAEFAPVSIPPDIPDEDVIFEASRYVRGGLIEDIEYIVYIQAAKYYALPTRQRRLELARVVGRINRKLEPRSFVLMGPGRWGSNDILLGVPVRYADLNRCRLLIEIAHQKDGFCPEVSFGTHFFQDLVEAGIDYIPLYPDEDGTRFNEKFLATSPNALADVVPQDAEFARDIQVIHVPRVTGGRRLTVAMDGENDKALGYLC